MASFFGNRPSYVTASWANQRIYPRTEPTFDQPAATAPPASAALRRSSSPGARITSPLGPTTSRRSTTTTATAPLNVANDAESVPTTATTRPDRPPPLYFPGVHRQQTRPDDPALPPNHIPSINVATTRLAQIEWSYHPIPLRAESFVGKVRKWTRFAEIGTSLRQDREVLYDGWPREFGGNAMPDHLRKRKPGPPGRDDEEASIGGRLSRSLSRRSGQSRADSGIALSSGPTLESQHPLERLFRKRVDDLNDVVAEGLVMTRAWLALTELMWIVWFVALIIALGTGRGGQSGFLKGVEIGLVCVILLTALAINGVRMRRWALSEQLRKRTRDWSPLPITSSTNAQLMRNYLDGDADERTGTTDFVPPAARKDSPVLRWRLRETEGSYWLSYRPIIRCELITPATYIPAPSTPPPIDDGVGDEIDFSTTRLDRGARANELGRRQVGTFDATTTGGRDDDRARRAVEGGPPSIVGELPPEYDAR
ncbi:hypothetical protein JCM10212_004105 [Sporobolomyces blumeae]